MPAPPANGVWARGAASRQAAVSFTTAWVVGEEASPVVGCVWVPVTVSVPSAAGLKSTTTVHLRSTPHVPVPATAPATAMAPPGSVQPPDSGVAACRLNETRRGPESKVMGGGAPVTEMRASAPRGVTEYRSSTHSRTVFGPSPPERVSRVGRSVRQHGASAAGASASPSPTHQARPRSSPVTSTTAGCVVSTSFAPVLGSASVSPSVAGGADSPQSHPTRSGAPSSSTTSAVRIWSNATKGTPGAPPPGRSHTHIVGGRARWAGVTRTG